MLKPKLIVFDLNKTLIDENTWLNLNQAMGVTQLEDELLVQWGQEGIVSDAVGQSILCALYKHRGKPTKDRLTQIVCDYHYRSGARNVVQVLQTRGYDIALISGSMDILVEHVATELGIVHYAANNHFLFDTASVLQEIRTTDNDYSFKVSQLEKICASLKISVKDTMCVGDGANDVLLFEACGNGVTFEDSKYKEKAKYTVNSLDDLLTIVD